MDPQKFTEHPSAYRHLEAMDTMEVLRSMNREDRQVADVLASALEQVRNLVDAVADHLLAGGRLFYIGAGTSGRLGVLDASECPPTFGVEPGLVIGVIAGGPAALQQAVEFAEDDWQQGWKDLEIFHLSSSDFVIGISASGTTPYVCGALEQCRKQGIQTGCITCNPASPLSQLADFPVETVTGPEFITGSTRLKAGTAQKMALNMISTAVMIRLGRVEDNQMVHMQLSNEKLIDRGVKMLMKELQLTDYALARDRLLRHGSVKKAIGNYRT